MSDATTPIDNEANDIEQVDFTCEIRGKEYTFTVPADIQDVPMEAVAFLEEGKLNNAFLRTIGPAQAHKCRNLRGKDIADIADEWFSVTGVDKGE